MKKILDYLNLRNVGILELVFALTPLLMGFSLGPLPLSVLMWLLLIGICIIRNGKVKPRTFNPLVCFIVYWGIHQLLWMLSTDLNINAQISQVIYFSAIFFLYPSMDANKIRGAMNWVAIISILGLLFQWSEIVRGNGVHPLEIPGLSMAENRVETDSLRPSSFYMEPAAYVSYMICPLALALIDKKYIWAVIMILTIFLTTSTTGILLSFILLAASLLSNKAKGSSILIVLVLGAGMVYALNTLEEFSAGLEKLENTDASTNVRLSQGPNVVSSMQPGEYIFGVPYSSAYNYCKAGRFTDVVYYGESVYMSTFWDMILRFGIVGLFFYLLIYFKLFKMSRLIWPMLFCLLATMFSDPDAIGPSYSYKLIFMLVIATSEVRHKQSFKIKSKINNQSNSL